LLKQGKHTETGINQTGTTKSDHNNKKRSNIYRFNRRSFTIYYDKEKKKNDDVGGAEKIFPSGIDDRD
jgi:hypothetical protein